jgi:hypothetical protein
VTRSVPLAAGLAGNWWFWALTAAALLTATALSNRYRRVAASIRAEAMKRRLVELPAGRRVARDPRSFWSDISWLAFLAGLWVLIAPWTWDYEDAGGAIATDVVTGALTITLALVAIVFPALWALDLVAGLWLVIAPWLVGYGDANGPVGLSDSIAGVTICAVAIASLSASERAIRAGEGRAIGRIRPPPPD